MKKWSAFFLVVLVLFSCATLVIARNLEAEGKKKVTVKSEIERGHDAAFGAPGISIDLLDNLDAISAVFKINKQRNMDSPGFLLGASFGAWSILAIKLEVLKGRVKQDEYDLAYKEAIDYFKDFRKLQQQLKIDDATLLGITGGKKPLENKIYLWESKIKKGKP